MELAAEMRNIVKIFSAVVANDNINFKIKKGQIHGIIGENGAGKTTLMKQLYGMYKPDAGEILINGKHVELSSPKDAIAHRIGMVHQHFTLVPSMTVLENIILGRPPQKKGFIHYKKAHAEVKILCEKYKFDLNLDSLVKDLPVGIKQRIEILKSMYLGADILIMDEPTAVLTPQEIYGLFATLKELKSKGTSIILITHKLSEVIAITEEVTVLRDGKVTGNVLTKDTNELELARMMVARDVLLRVNKKESNPGETVLDVQNIRLKNEDGVLILDDISLNVKAGEIVGIAGVQGNGQTELIDVLTGLNSDYKGKISICGNEGSPGDNPWKRRKMGCGHIPEDRQAVGSCLDASIEDNFLMTIYRTPQGNKRGIISRKLVNEQLNRSVQLFNIKLPGKRAMGYSLSGGNMQKLIFAREYNLNPKLLIAAQPTRGVDIGATEFIHNKLIEMRDLRKAILLISNELSEILSLSDRILVMYKGRIIGQVQADEADENQIGLLMAGIVPKKNKEEAIKE